VGIGVKAPMLYVPHFKYVFKKSYERSGLSDDIVTVFTAQGKVRFLFFGNLSIVKGVDLVTDVFGHLSKEQRDKVELVIAGKNVDGMDFSSLRSTSPNFKVFDRHINDDEMVYLYSRTDYVLLPYRKSSQSGIFAMAAYFRKPMLMTDIPYFRKMMTKYPSFGCCVPECGYGKLVEDTIKNHSVAEFYTREDCDKSDDREQTDAFMNAFNAMLE
jgi:glycosyltransferase involved in cell wall biosynthesis